MAAEIILSENHIDPNRDPGYLIYKIGYVGPLVDGDRNIAMLWGNSKNKGVSSFIALTDTFDTTYAGVQGYIPVVVFNEGNQGLQLKSPSEIGVQGPQGNQGAQGIPGGGGGPGGDVLLAEIYNPTAIGGILLCSPYNT